MFKNLFKLKYIANYHDDHLTAFTTFTEAVQNDAHCFGLRFLEAVPHRCSLKKLFCKYAVN